MMMMKMMYNTMDYWGFGLRAPSKDRRLALSNGPNRVGSSYPHLRTETDPVSETLRSLVDRLCDLVVRVPGYRSRGSGFDSRRY
jgi:hypothetical protein